MNRYGYLKMNKLKGFGPAYVVNLKDHTHRLKSVKEQFKLIDRDFESYDHHDAVFRKFLWLIAGKDVSKYKNGIYYYQKPMDIYKKDSQLELNFLTLHL